MPVVSIRWGNKTASALTDSCVIITDAGVYSRPYNRGSRVTSVIFDAFIRHPNLIVRFLHGRYCIGLSIGAAVGITYIQMHRECDFNLLAFEFHSPRIAWLAQYERIKRRMALAMASHPRLGEESALRVLGNDVILAIVEQL